MPVGKSRQLTDFEKNLKEEIYKRDNHIDNSVKYAIDTGQDYGVSKDTPQWRRDAINKYRDSHKVEIYDDNGNLVGTVGYEAHKAINKNKVFDYKGKNDEEKKVFSYLRQRQNRESRKKEQREYVKNHMSNPEIEKLKFDYNPKTSMSRDEYNAERQRRKDNKDAASNTGKVEFFDFRDTKTARERLNRQSLPEFVNFRDVKSATEKLKKQNTEQLPEFGSYKYYENQADEKAKELEEIDKYINDNYSLDDINIWQNAKEGVRDAGENAVKYNSDEKLKGIDNLMSRKADILDDYVGAVACLEAYEGRALKFKEDGSVDTDNVRFVSGNQKKRYEVMEKYGGSPAPEYMKTPRQPNEELNGELAAAKGEEEKQTVLKKIDRYQKDMLDPTLNKITETVDKSKKNVAVLNDNIDAANYYDKNKDNKYGDGVFGRIAGNYRIGDIGEERAMSAFNSYSYSDSDLTATQIYDELSRRIQERNKDTFTNTKAWQQNLATIAQYVPQGRNQAIARLKGAAVGSVIPLVGSKTGGDAAAAMYMFKQTAGNMYADLILEEGLSPEEAKKLSANNALWSGVVEYGLESALGGVLKGIGKGVKKIAPTEKVIKVLEKTGLSEEAAKKALSAAKTAGNYAVGIFGEGAEEWIQQGGEIVTKRYAAKGESASALKIAAETFDFSKYTDEDFDEMNEAFKGGAVIGFASTVGSRAAVNLAQSGMDKLAAHSDNKAVGKAALTVSQPDVLINRAIDAGLESSDEKTVGRIQKLADKYKSGNASAAEVGEIIKTGLRTGYEQAQNLKVTEDTQTNDDVALPTQDTARQSVLAAAISGNSVISPSVTAAANVSERQMHDVKENLSEGGAAQSVEQVQNAVKKVTNTMINEFKNSNIKNIPDYQAAYNENLRLSTTKGATIDKDFIKTYANQYAEGLKRNNSKAYKELASVSDDVGSMLTDYLISNRIPQGIGDISALAQAGGELRSIIGKAAQTTLAMNGKIYNDTDRVSAISNEISNGNFAVVDGANDGNIALAKVGEYYEAYGADAVALAKAFNVSTHYIQKNGRKTLVAAVPSKYIGEYAAKLGYSGTQYSAGGNEYIYLTKDAERGNLSADAVRSDITAESDSDFIAEIEKNGMIELDERPSESKIETIAAQVERDNTIPVYLDGVDKLGEVLLVYANEEDVTRNMVKTDINSYYDGVMPERGIPLSENTDGHYDEDTIEISERPSEYDADSYALVVELDRTIPILLNGVDELGEVELNYSNEENVTRDMVKSDIDAYYSGTMPERGVSLSNNYDPDIKFSVDEDFAAKYDRWVENGGNYRQTLNVGRTSETLKSIGVPDKKITWDTAKIAKIKEKHNVDDNIIKQVPYILEEPIVIMKSLQKSSRITLCGEVYDLNNKPVMAILELNPTNAKGDILLDEIKLVSAYGKDNLQNLINKSEILYVEPNKKRTNDWLTQNRLQLPLGQTNHRYNINISQNDDVVNSNIRKNSENDTDSRKNLVAIHNSSAEKLSKTLDLGGFAMPSIAVTKNDIPHENFGDISVVFNKDTVDPKADRRNKVYSADAWTPTFPQIEYEANPDVVSSISEKRYDIAKRFGHDAAYGISKYSDSLNIEDKLNRYNGESGVIEQAKNDIDLMKSFLYDIGIGEVAPVEKRTTNVVDKKAVEMYDFYIQKLGKGLFEDLKRRPNEGVFAAKTRWIAENEGKFDKAFLDYIGEELGISGDDAQKILKGQTKADKLKTAIQIRNYLSNGAETVKIETDISATNEKIKRLAKENGFDNWVDDLFGGIENDRGMYNGVDPYTESGSRRSFKQTHYDVTLENIVKSMQAQNDGDVKNVSGFVGTKSLRASLAKTFGSIADMHDTEGRLENLSDKAVNKINDNLNSRLENIIGRIYNTREHSEYDNRFIEIDHIGNILVEACELEEKSAGNIKKLFENYQYDISDKTANDVIGLLFDVSQMPVRIFEAKSERVVGLNEVAFAVMPAGKYPELKAKFESKGIEVKTYDPNTENSRLDVINSRPDIRFSQDNSLDGGGIIRYNDDIDIPYRESKQLREYIMSENNRNGGELKSFDKKEIGDNFYVWKNNSKTDYDVVMQIEIDGNEDVIDLIRKGLDNGETYGIDNGTKRLDEIIAGIRDRRRGNNSDNARNTAELSNGNDDRLYSRQSSDDDGIKFAREGGRSQQNTEVGNYGRDDILNGNDRRTFGESERERGSDVQEIAGNASGNAGEKQSSASSRRIYARDVKEAGGVERRNDRGVEADFVKSEYYNDEMRRIAAENDERGVVTHFILGNGRAIEYGTNFRGAVRGNEVYIQADHGRYSPSQINRHEIIHRNYSSDTVQELKNRIKSRLTNEQIRDIAESLYRDYAQKRRSFDEIFEEFVCDVMADMNDYAEMFETETREYWAAEEQDRKGYSPSTYTESIDAGGKNVAENKSQQWSQSRGLQLPKLADTIAVNNNISQNDNIVNDSSGNTVKSSIAVYTDNLPVKYRNKNEARKEFVGYARENFPKSVVNNDTKSEIGISRTGIDKFLSGNISIQKYATGFKIPELIESAVKVGEAENQKGKTGINGYEYYYNTININNKDFAVHIRVRNTDMGDKYYGHTISQNVVDIEIEPLAWNSDKKSVHSINAFGSNNTNISQNDNIVKSSIRENSENDIDIRFSTDENTDVNAFDDEDMSYLSEPVKNIRNDINEVINRADLKKGGKVYDRAAAVRVRDSILDNISIGDIQGIDMRTKKDRAVMTVLVSRALNSAGVDAKRKSARDLTRYIAQNASVYDADSLCADGGVDYEGDRAVILNYIKHGVKISPDAKEAIISAVGENSARGYIAMMSNNSALGIDSVYDELSVALPGYFASDALTEGEKMRRVIDVYTWLKDGKSMQDVKLIDVMTPDDARAFTELVQKQLELAFDTMGRDSAISREVAAERTKYEQRLSDIREKYEAKIADMRNSAKKKQSDGAKAKNISTEQTGNRFKNLAEAAKKYGAIKKGANAVRDIEMPKRIDDNRYVSRFARTMAEAGVTPDESLSEFERDILDGKMTYERITDEEAKKSATDKIMRRGFMQALDDWNEMILSNQRIGKNEMALGQTLYNQCINAKDAQNAMKIAADLANIATQAGQTVQACALIKQMSPDCQLYSLEQSVEKMKREFENKRKFVSGEKRKIDLEINEELAQKLLNAKTEDERRAVMDEILQDIANQIPSTLKDKWDSWRYLSMLGNPRTHIRNIGGNAVFMLPVKVKNAVGWILEKTISKDKRTKSLKSTKDSKNFAAADYAKMKDIIQGSSGKYEELSKINELRRIYKFKPLEWLRKANFAALEWEDGIFLKHHYVNAMAQFLTARGYTSEFMNSGTKDAASVLENARAYAMSEAQKATYRDANAIAETLSRWQRNLQNNDKLGVRVVGQAVEGIVPFKKTPLNIAKRGVEYSPIGLISGLYDAAANIKSGKVTAAQAIDKIASGFTGTGLVILGMGLSKLGLVRGDDDDDDKLARLDSATGEQSYSFKIGNHSYTIDWVAPASMPFFMGVSMWNAFEKTDKFTFEEILNAVLKIPAPLLNLSVLSSLNDLIRAGDYSSTPTEKMADYAWQATTSYVGQAFPTVMGQIARTVDKTKRNASFTDPDNGLPAGLDRFIARQVTKIPGLSKILEPKIDMWGREETYGDTWYGRLIGNTISPGYYKEINSTALDDELRRLGNEYEGDGSVLPPKAPKYFTYEKQKYYMTPSEYAQYSVIRGQKSFEYADELIRTDDYKNKSAEEKKKALEKCYDAAGDEAKNEILKGRGIDVAAKEAEKAAKKKSKKKTSKKKKK